MLPNIIFALLFLVLLLAPVSYAAFFAVAVSLGFFGAWAASSADLAGLLKRWVVPLALGVLLAFLKTRDVPAFKYDLLLVLALPLVLTIAAAAVKGRPAVFVFCLLSCILAVAYFDVRAHGWLGRTWTPIRVSRGPIVCLGDSLTAGVGTSPDQAYPALLERALKLPVINAGVAGDTSADVLRRLDGDVLAKRPEAVVLLVGGNDFLQHVPEDQFRRNLDSILARLEAANLPVLLVQQPTGPFSGRFFTVYPELARRHGALLFPETTLKRFYLHPNDYLADSIHWNARGHREFTDHLLEYFQRG